MKSRSSTFS